MGKIILMNGSCHENGNTYIALEEIRKELEKRGVEAEHLWLGTGPVQDCTACGGCKGSGICSFDGDAVNAIIRDLDSISGIIAGSPVYYGGPSGRICSILDRLFYASGPQWAGKIGASVVVCRRGGATASFERLNQFFLMNNMVVPASQYWNQVHGRRPGDALEDAEGLQTMRTLAANIAWLLENIGDSKAPAYEPVVMTSFVR